jgi:hypothetical protein
MSTTGYIPIAIVGTAGRGADGKRLNIDVYQRMLESVQAAVGKLTSGAPWKAVSGGSAWADHVAVSLFLSGNASALELHVPAELHFDGYVDNGAVGSDAWKINPGARLNELHATFSQATNRDSFVDICDASLRPNFSVELTPGMHPRNLKVAERAQHCIALTFGSGARVADGGTHFTMNAFLGKHGSGRSVHVDLNDMRMYSPARL